MNIAKGNECGRDQGINRHYNLYVTDPNPGQKVSSHKVSKSDTMCQKVSNSQVRLQNEIFELWCLFNNRFILKLYGWTFLAGDFLAHDATFETLWPETFWPEAFWADTVTDPRVFEMI